MCVHEEVAAVAAARAHSIALHHGSRSVTYGELEETANALARVLREGGVGSDRVVGLFLERSAELVIAQYAVLKAGGAFVTLDPEAPLERLAYMADDARLVCVITGRSVAARLPATITCPVVPFESAFDAPTSAVPLAARRPNPLSLAYINYTSGSTGRPKAAALTHEGLAQLASWHIREFGLTHEDITTVVAGLAFDALVWEIWPALAAGAQLNLANEADRLSAERLRDWLVAQRVTVSFLPTPVAEAAFRLAWPRPSHLRLLITGGSKVHRYPPESLPFTVVNVYGLAETTVICTSGVIPASDAPMPHAPSVGKAIDGSDVMVLDDALSPVPPGTVGELYVGGASLARGYLGRAKLTAERFLPHPSPPTPGARMYRTGDRAFTDATGAIHFLGRYDDQVKIRGVRVELGEVEAALRAIPQVTDAAVVVRASATGEDLLVAYLEPGLLLPASELRQILGRSLPEAMVPSRFVGLPALPLTSNGKVDRAALPSLESLAAAEPSAFADPREEALAAIWRELLATADLGPNDNFFELGGDSMTAGQLAVRARTIGLRITARDVFAWPTIAELAANGASV